MFGDILDIKKMIDLVIAEGESKGLTYYGLVQEMKYISNHIDKKVDKEVLAMEKYFEEQAEAFEHYDDAILVGSEQ
ncbi:MAG: hypothetical protein RLZZ196_1757 [Bacteroidota bacterium]|jgi:hypothetical protein